MKKRILSSLLACSLLFTVVAAPAIAFADDFDTQIEQKNKEITELQSKQAALQSQISSLEAEVAGINAKAQELFAKKETLTKETEQLQQEIADLEVRIERREEAIRNQARDVQVNGSQTTLIEAVINADSITDAIGRVQAMSTIVNANNDLVTQQKEDKQAVEDKKIENETKLGEIQETHVTLEAQKGELERSQADLAVAKADYALQQASKESEKEAIKERKAAAEAEQARIAEEARLAARAQRQAAQEAQAQEEAQAATSNTTNQTTNNQINNSQTSTNNNSSNNQTSSSSNNTSSSNTPSSSTTEESNTSVETPAPAPVAPTPTPAPAPSGNGSSVIAEAYKYLGVPYVWGGKTPSGFDCSGFTSYVFRNATGREIGGWTVPQESAGTKISVAEAQPGDLYFWGSAGSTYHVAIALGGGQYIHAPSPGQSVSVSSVGSWGPSFAVRM